MKIHKIEILVIDFDEVGEDGIVDLLENSKYPNHCISPQVKKVTTREIEWSDDHPLNLRSTADEEYTRLFPQ